MSIHETQYTGYSSPTAKMSQPDGTQDPITARHSACVTSYAPR
jgi:hypothetical protein